jgi:uncharacterized protein
MIDLMSAQVMHARLRPKQHRFRYRVPYVALSEAALRAPGRRGLFSIDRANLFSVRLADYGDGTSPLTWVRSILERWQIVEADGEIVLVTIPRILGVGFNPVSFWLCFDKTPALRAVVAEVNNTFGERHFYLCTNNDHRPIAPADRLTVDKVFHVSPFLDRQGQYRFAFAWNEKTLAIRIDLEDQDGPMLITSVSGERSPVSSRKLLLTFLSNPLVMFKVLSLIHYQAARLFLKGIAHVRKPPPPAERVTR